MNNEYNILIRKVQNTGNIIDRLCKIENDINLLVEEGNIDYQVEKLLEKCIDEINNIYIKNEHLDFKHRNGTLKEEL